jgi:hypothetical protein
MFMKRLFFASYCLLDIVGLIDYHTSTAAQTARRKNVTKEDVKTMLNGIWTIESSPPKEVAEMTSDFLPPKTRMQIKIEGPTRLAIEEGRRDELGGELILLPPFMPGICTTPLGEGNGSGAHVCEKGQIIDPNRPVSNDAEFTFQRWNNQSDTEQLGGSFFLGQGAKPGAQFVLINLRYKGVTWELWVRDRDTLVGAYIATLPSKDTEQMVQIWRRVKTP